MNILYINIPITNSIIVKISSKNELSEPLNQERKTSKDKFVKSCPNNSKQIVKNKKLRRGKKRSRNINRTITLFFNNIDGLLSKSNSLKSIISHLKPDIIMLCETKLSAKKNYNLEGYTTFQKNKNVHNGGLIIAIKNCFAGSAIEVSDVLNHNIMSIQIRCKDKRIRKN